MNQINFFCKHAKNYIWEKFKNCYGVLCISFVHIYPYCIVVLMIIIAYYQLTILEYFVLLFWFVGKNVYKIYFFLH